MKAFAKIILGWPATILAAIALFTYVSLPTSRYIEPMGYRVANGMVCFSRMTPRGGIPANFIMEVTPIDDPSRECRIQGDAFYQVKLNDMASYAVPAALAKCLTPGTTVTIRVRWQALLWGIIPLYPLTREFIVEVEPE
jgi:hypothetical protein